MAETMHYRTATALLRDLRSKKVSAVQLFEEAVDRIDHIDRKINAVVVRDLDRARQAAKAADAARARGEDTPLLGIPMTIKEATDVEGLPTTWGFPGFKDFVAKKDAAVVERIRAAGAVILGKTNVATFLADWQSNNPIYGRTNNPYDLTKTSGGSTAGAAAVAAGMVPLEIGSDLGGSIRVPASFCGVYGHKPSFGIVPLRGFKPPPAPDGAGIPVTALGPLSRSPDDIDLMISVLAGPDEMDATGYELALPKSRHERLDAFRVLIFGHHPAAALDAEILEALAGLADELGKLGAKVAHKSELMPDPMETLECFGKILVTATSRGGPPQDKPVTAHEWMNTLDQQFRIRRQWAALFQSFDVVLAPAFGTSAFPHDDGQGERTLLINGKNTPYAVQGAWSSLAGLGNLPATAVPIGMSKAGLPLGIQIIGPYLEDRTTIQFARLLEKKFGGFAPPDLD
jgi:amidase